MSGGTSAHSGRLQLIRVRHPDNDLLQELALYEREAFGEVGLRTYDLAVFAQAGAVYVAYMGEQIVGGCQLMRLVDEPDFFYVVGFYVRSPWRGRGLGRAMLAALGREVKRLGGKGLVLTVAPDNAQALKLYRAAGFEEEAFVRHFYGQGEDRYVLRLRFGPGA